MPTIETIDIELFADEIKEIQNVRTGERWTYIGLLAVPLQGKERLLTRLSDYRKELDCNSELHGKKLESSSKLKLAKKWVKEVVYRDKDERLMYFQILGINHSRLNMSSFGKKELDNMYNRFFRTVVLGLLRRSFNGKHIKIIHNIYHDRTNIEGHEFFPWHSIFHIARNQEDIVFHCNELTFIDSDHRNEGGGSESHFIQLIDILLSGVSECLDYTSERRSRITLGQTLYPLVKRMIHEPFNTKSSYGHSGKYLLSFFPQKQLSNEDLQNDVIRSQSGFYLNREILIEEMANGQENMFE